MADYLVVANLTLGGDHLHDTLAERAEQGPGRVHIVVPSGPDPSSWRSHTNEEGREHAGARLAAARERFAALGLEVTGEVGDPSPVQAIGDAIRERGPFDEIILSTLPPGPSRWLGMDLPKRVARAYDVPLTHLVAAAEPVS